MAPPPIAPLRSLNHHGEPPSIPDVARARSPLLPRTAHVRVNLRPSRARLGRHSHRRALHRQCQRPGSRSPSSRSSVAQRTTPSSAHRKRG
jgi:hypothetical protein